ncbi:MAG: exodeoxyribonuclease VII large subunit, partial [Oscillospiraceae bacterium]|nr:exodeoxyribonuclease VII large subunit [Oscillospiraceae bacterium]
MTVSALNEYISGKMKGDSTLSDLLISGEISGFKHHSSGHMYFLLKDENSQINCVMFRGQASKLQFEPLNGMKVLIQGSVQVFV